MIYVNFSYNDPLSEILTDLFLQLHEHGVYWLCLAKALVEDYDG